MEIETACVCVCVCACVCSCMHACVSLAGWSIVLVENEEARLLHDYEELDSFSYHRLVSSVPDLGGSLQAVEC
jgi:hypothetical protein